MMPALYDELPGFVIIDGAEYAVITDYREWIRLIDLARDESLTAQEKCGLIMEWFPDSKPESIESAIDALASFVRCEKSGEASVGASKVESGQQAFSYRYDADAILIGFMQIYGIDLYDTEYLHWWKFKALLEGLPEDTEFKRRIYYRTLNPAEIENSKEKQRIMRIKKKVALPFSELRELSDDDIGSAFW